MGKISEMKCRKCGERIELEHGRHWVHVGSGSMFCETLAEPMEDAACELCGRTCDSELPAVCLACHNKVQAEYVRLKAKVRELATEEEDTVHEREKMSATEEKDMTRAFDNMNERDMIMASIDRLSENKAAKELADVAHYANMMLAEIVK